jgi:hypothetical protein
MSRISQDIEKLEQMVDDDATKEDVKSQLRFIAREVATLEADCAALEHELTELQSAHAEVPLQHSRGLLYASDDDVPFCPRCFEGPAHLRVHLFGPVPMFDPQVQRWECHTCNAAYAAKPGENFLAGSRRRGRA